MFAGLILIHDGNMDEKCEVKTSDILEQLHEIMNGR
jgi:hypothetical protein